MAIRAGDPGLAVRALAPVFKIGMLGFQQRRPGIGMLPVLREAERFGGVVFIHCGWTQPLVPGEDHPAGSRFEEVFRVALAADITAHFLAAGFFDVDAPPVHRFQERRIDDPQIHRSRVVTVAADHRMLRFGGQLAQRNFRITPAHVPEELLDLGGLAGNTGAHAGRADPLRFQQIMHCIGMAAVLRIILAERVSFEIHQNFRLLQGFLDILAAAVSGGRGQHLPVFQITGVLQGIILSPDRRVILTGGNRFDFDLVRRFGDKGPDHDEPKGRDDDERHRHDPFQTTVHCLPTPFGSPRPCTRSRWQFVHWASDCPMRVLVTVDE